MKPNKIELMELVNAPDLRERFMRVAQSLTELDKQCIELDVLRCCADVMMNGDAVSRNEAAILHEQMLREIWSRQARASWPPWQGDANRESAY